MPKRDEFVGRVALVTGGAGAGIGSATCRVLASYGAAIVVLDSHENRTRETAKIAGGVRRAGAAGRRRHRRPCGL